jgi:hypothetical protein
MKHTELLICVKLRVTKNIDWGVFENRVLRKIFGPKRQEKLPPEKLHALYTSPNFVWLYKLRKTKW